MLCLCIKYESGAKVDSILFPHMQQSREALADVRKSIRKRIENVRIPGTTLIENS